MISPIDLMVRRDTRVLGRLSEIDAVAHRVVRGGARYTNAVEIDDKVEKEIARKIEKLNRFRSDRERRKSPDAT
jgi:acetate kinase